MIWLKNHSCHSIFNKKNINTFDVLTFIQNTFDVLTFIQMHIVLTDKKFTGENDYMRNY